MIIEQIMISKISSQHYWKGKIHCRNHFQGWRMKTALRFASPVDVNNDRISRNFKRRRRSPILWTQNEVLHPCLSLHLRPPRTNSKNAVFWQICRNICLTISTNISTIRKIPWIALQSHTYVRFNIPLAFWLTFALCIRSPPGSPRGCLRTLLFYFSVFLLHEFNLEATKGIKGHLHLGSLKK